MLLKIRLTFVCKYKYSKQTSNSLKKKNVVFLFVIYRTAKKKKPSRTRVKDFLRLFYKALTVTDANIQLKYKTKKKWVLNYQQLFIN